MGDTVKSLSAFLIDNTGAVKHYLHALLSLIFHMQSVTRRMYRKTKSVRLEPICLRSYPNHLLDSRTVPVTWAEMGSERVTRLEKSLPRNAKTVIIKLPDFFLCRLETVSHKIHRLILGYRIALNYNLLWLKTPLFWLIGQTVLQQKEIITRY